MNRTPFLARLAPLAPLLLVTALLQPAPARAQYLYLDANGDGLHTDADVVDPSGTTHVDVWLDTQHDRDGSLQTCNSHTGDPVTSSDTGIDLFSYNLYLLVDHGAVDWGHYEDHLGFEALSNDQVDTHTDTAIQIVRFADLDNEKPAGRYELGSMTITTVGGTPVIRFGLMENWDLTGFGTHCDASRDYPNTYLFGVDFFDADGLPCGVPINHEPVIAPIAPVTAIQNHPSDVTLQATDEDLQPLTFSKLSGPDFVTVTSLPTAGQGNLHAAPGNTNLGTYSVQVRVSDGVFWTDRFLTVTARRELTIRPIADLTLQAGNGEVRYLGADNPLSGDLTYSLLSAPSFVSVVTGAPGSPYASVRPAATDVGNYSVTVGVSNGTIHDETTFRVFVTAAPVVVDNGSNYPPVPVIRGPLEAVAARPVKFNGGYSYDSNHDALGFSWNFGDGSPLSTDWRPQHVFNGEGTFRVDLTVNDKQYFRTASLTVSVLPAASARAFVTDRGHAGQDLVVRVQPIHGLFDPAELTPDLVSTFSLTNAAGRHITAIGLDGSDDTDGDRDGTADRGILFAGTDVTPLIVEGAQHGVAMLTLRGALSGGGQFAASLVVTSDRHGQGALAAQLSPNPMNPVGKLSFVTTRTGRTDVTVYDVAGRMVHHPIDGTTLEAGYHELLVGRGHFGEDLPSGLYFYRVESDEGVARGRFAIVR